MPRQRSLQVESLESRLACAGNVTAALQGTTLVITGQAEANAISVVKNVFGDITVRGLPFAGKYSAGEPVFTGPKTTVNSNAQKVFDGDAVKNISLHLNGGNDAAKVSSSNSLFVLKDMLADLGAGSDYFDMGGVFFTGIGALTIKMQQATGPAGNNELGNDSVKLNSVHAASDTKFVTTLGGGADKVDIVMSSFDGPASVFLGNGADRFVFGEGSLNNAKVDAGGANDADYVAFLGLTMNRLEVLLGSGNDKLRIADATIAEAKLDGGIGTDDLTTVRSDLTSNMSTNFES